MKARNIVWTAGLVVFGAAAGCGSGGGGGAVTGLGVPAEVTLVDANGSGSMTSILANMRLEPVSDRIRQAVTTFDADPTRFYVRDDSMQSLSTVNVILCSVGQTGFDDPDVLNAGPYVALINCETRGSSGGDSGRGGDAPQFQRFVVDSSRASRTAPHIVEVWFDQNNGGTPTRLYARLTITESPSDTAPYGAFRLSFKSLLLTQSHDDPNVESYGYLRTVPRDDGRAEFVFFERRGDVTATLATNEDAYRNRARLVASADGTTGQAYSEDVFAYNSGSGTMTGGAEYFLEYDQAYLARKKVEGSETVEVFDRNDFSTRVYRYGVYDNATGVGVQRQSGFGLETEDGDFGWVGYHGLWFPQGVTITDGQRLIRRSFDPGTPSTEYDAVVVQGRLTKGTRATLTLADIEDEDLELFDPSTGTRQLVQWDGTDLVRVGTENMSGGFDRLMTPVVITGDYTDGDFLDFYSSARGNVQFEWPSGGPTGTSTASTLTFSPITAASAEVNGSDLTLYGYRQQLRSLITQDQADFNMSMSPWFSDATSVSSGNMDYVFNATTQMLTLGGSEVRLADGVTVQGGFGFQCGPLFASPLTALSDIPDQNVQYLWQTGPNQYNQLRTVRAAGGGAIVEFDEPLRLSYTHSETGSPYDGRTFILEWTGDDLQGVPFLEVSGSERYVPAFNIPSGAVATALGGSTQYRIKALEGEQEMNSVMSPMTVITAQGFDLDTTLAAPVDDFDDPAIGAMPVLTTPPKFVSGVEQGDEDV